LLIVLTADHGEALGEHGELTHGLFVYDSTVLVPLIFHWPGRIAARRSDDPVRLVDVAPTIIELAGLDRLEGAEGRSVAADDGSAVAPAAVVETWLPWTYFGWAPLTAWRERGEKYIDAPTPELYDLATDPHERTNLAGSDVARTDRLALRLSEAKTSPAAIAAASADDAAIAKLRSLGYVGVGSTIDAPPAGLADPKDRIAQRDQLQQAEGMLRARRFEEAQTLFARVLEHDPDNRFALLRSGVALLALDRAAQAERVLQRAVTVEPRRAESRFALGDALMRLQRYDDAAAQWSVLAELQPRRVEAWFNLAAALDKAGHADRAATARAEYDRLQADRSRAGGP
jgi:choline-sulfatase